MVGLRKLFLDYNKLSGTLSPKIGNLVNLEDFFAFNNRLGGQIPAEIGQLKNLKNLILSENEFLGTLPNELLELTKLTLLALQQTMKDGPGIGGKLLDFATLADLKVLYLGPNSLTGTIPSNFLGGSTKTSKNIVVDLSYNFLQGMIPSELTRFDKLEVHLQGNEFTGIAPDLCLKQSWQNEAVGLFGCDAIMCPPNTFNKYGRQEVGFSCEECEFSGENPFYGSTDCLSGQKQQALFEQDILQKLYADANGPNWKFDTNWLDNEKSLCDWYGISCPEDGLETVEVIYLARSSLLGPVPADLFSLPNLKELHLGENMIDFSFEGIGQATKLERLILDGTGLKSLDGVGEATSLKTLHLRSNDLSGNIASDLFSLANLVELDLSDNRFDGELPAGLRNLGNLKSFSCFKNVLSGFVPQWIGDLANLEYLRLDRNDFSGTLPNELGDLIALEYLDMSEQTYYGGQGLTGSILDFADATRMTELNLRGNNFGGNIPSTFLAKADSSEVISVDLSDNHLEGTLPTDLARLERLSIYLSNNEIKDFSLQFCDSVPRWMGGNVEEYGCDVILCPPQSFSDLGRQHSLASECQSCDANTVAPFYGSTECTMSERGVLEKLFQATGGPNRTDKTNWMNSDSICTWYGVTCSNEEGGDKETATKLELGNNALFGAVPSQIRDLASLIVLDVSGNVVDITFQGVGRASDLASVNVDSTSVKSLQGIGQARSLKELHAQENNFMGSSIPDEIFSLYKLERLYLSASNLAGQLSDKLGDLFNLKEFVCSDNNIRGTIPSAFGKLDDLSKLVLSENDLSGTLPDVLGTLTNMVTLHINSFTRESTGITGHLPDFSKLSELTELALGSNRLTGTIPSSFMSGSSKTSEEVKVILASNRLNGTLPVSLQRFEQLVIDVTDNHIEAIPPKLCEMQGWMRGRVGRFGCDAILCNVGTFNLHGRRSNVDLPCTPCGPMKIAEFYGSMQCVLDEEKNKEREILKKVYDECGGQRWYKQKNWLDDSTDICQWEGLSCHKGKYIDSILLGANNIVGTPPRELFDLPALEWLWLYSNPISFSFANIANATNLRSLILDSTGLTSMAGIGQAKGLTELDVRFNSFSGPLPEEIGLLTDIESLSFSDNDFSGTLPSFLESLTKLRKLRLGSNRISGPLRPFELSNEMRSLDLSGNKITGEIPDNLMASSSGLSDVFIDLSSNQLSGTAPVSLGRFKDLTIYLKDNIFEAIDPDLCELEDWNDGNVGNFGCDAIMCPMGTYNRIGRQSRQSAPCEPCRYAPFYGAVDCTEESARAKAGAGSTASTVCMKAAAYAIFLMTALLMGQLCWHS